MKKMIRNGLVAAGILVGSLLIVTSARAHKAKHTPQQLKAFEEVFMEQVRIGDLLFCAGQIPLDPATGNLVPGDIKAQTERVLENVKAILDDQKLTFTNVVKSTVFLTNLADFAGMNEVYAKYFTGEFPARSTIQVAALPRAASVEIEVIAHY